MTLDAFDRKILDVVQDDNRITNERLGEKVGLSTAACQKRLARLRAAGIIAADIAVVSPEAVGRVMTMVVQVTMVREDAHLLTAFKESMRKTPEVMQCYYVTGEADFVLIVTVENMTAYEAFTHRFFTENPNIARFNTSVVMDSVKVGLRVPLAV